MSLAEKLRAAQLRDVQEMQAIRDTAAATGDAGQACSLILGGDFNLTPIVADGIMQQENKLAKHSTLLMKSPLLRGRPAIKHYLEQMVQAGG